MAVTATPAFVQSVKMAQAIVTGATTDRTSPNTNTVLLWTAAWLIGRVLTSRLLDGISLLRSEQFVIEAAAGMSAFTNCAAALS